MRGSVRLPSASAAQRVEAVGGPSRLGILTLLASVCSVVFAPGAFGQDSPEIFREIQLANLSASDTADREGPNVVRSRYVEVDLARILAAGAQEARPARARGESRKRLTFNLFTDAVQEFEEERAEYSPDGRTYSWFGRPTSSEGGQAVLVVNDGNVAGSVRTRSGEFYRIRSVSSSVHVIRQVTYQGAPAVNDAVPVPESEVPQTAQAQDVTTAQQSGTTTLDVMVVYTPGARQAAGGTSGIQSEIQLAIAELNQSFSNSGVQMQARLAHSAEVSYNDEQNSLSTTLGRLRTSGDGYMDQVHSLRDQYGADVVALLVNGPGSNGGTVGIGYIMQTVGSYFSAYAFSVTEVNFATGPSYAVLHEIGHNLGAAHDRTHASSAGAYSYSYGFQRSQTPRFRTIMSYNCSGVNCPTVNNWSNPNVNHQGYPTGVSSNSSTAADNRLTLNNTRTTAAGWRDSGSGGGSGGGGGATNSAPSAVSVGPSSGSGSSRTFSYSFSDGNGNADMTSVLMLINNALNAQTACYLYYSRSANRLYLASDSGSVWLGPLALGSSGTIQNSQCTVNGGSSSVSASGNTLTLNVALSFPSGFAGSKTNYMFVQDSGGLSSGWQSRGTWAVPGGATNSPPSSLSVTPSSGNGSSQTFAYRFTDSNGFANIISAQMILNDSLRTTGGCYTYYAPAANKLYLMNDQGSAWLGPVTLGASGTVSNSQCSLNGAASSASGSGTTLTINVAATFTSGFAGTKNNYVFAHDSGGLSSAWESKGSWTVPSGSGGSGGGSVNQAPTAMGVTPSSGSGSTETFGFRFSDPNGYTDLPAAQMLIGPALSTTGSCYLYFARSSNLLFLMNDAASAWLGPVSIGSSATIENSRCRLTASQSSVLTVGNDLTVNLRLTFKSGFQGAKRSYLFTQDTGGLSTGWQQGGTWSVP